MSRDQGPPDDELSRYLRRNREAFLRAQAEIARAWEAPVPRRGWSATRVMKIFINALGIGFITCAFLGMFVPGIEFRVYFGTTDGALAWHREMIECMTRP